ncbi:MAG: hypothetical protein JNM18_15635 [Planctomycetaceae bacterium]|nr:hypothetical protein [Planctomycetaceae bacterium]
MFKKDRFTIGDLCEADLLKAIDLAPMDPEPQRWLGRLKREQGDARGGDEIFAKAVELAKATDEPRLVLVALRDWAENQLLLEQVDEAHQRADQIADLKPLRWMRDAGPFQKLAAFIHGEAWFRLSKWSDAIAAYDQALPSDKLDSATLDDLPLLMHRAEARCRLKLAESEAVVAASKLSLTELLRARSLAADSLTQAAIHAQAAGFAIRAVEALPPGDIRASQLRQEGLDQAQAALALNATSQESVAVRLIQFKLLLHKLAALSPTAPERAALRTQCRELHAEAQRLALQTGLATELGELIRLADRL